MWVKICANTNLEDALQATELGADAVGFVFAPSKRQVTAEQVTSITAQLPQHVERVGVFPEMSAEEIAGIVDIAGLTAVQLHGGVDPGLTDRLRKLIGPATSLIQVVHWKVGGPADMPLADFAAQDRVLVDAKVGEASGGTGVAFDWVSAREFFDRQRARGVRLILAGGLRPENVGEAIRTLQPWGVDVASGVESEPGRKDLARLKAFIDNARAAG